VYTPDKAPAEEKTAHAFAHGIDIRGHGHVDGKPYYNPAKSLLPTLLVLAEWDDEAPP
jgi:hypothetical protein